LTVAWLKDMVKIIVLPSGRSGQKTHRVLTGTIFTHYQYNDVTRYMQKTILIIEDDERIRELLRTFLEAAGYLVVDAENGAVGIKKYRENTIDLVITDLIMPEKEGIETIRELKALNPQVKIIAMSGGGVLNPEEYLSIAKRLGVLRTLAKPFSREEIVTAVNQACA